MLLQHLYEHKLKRYRQKIDSVLEAFVSSEKDPKVKEMLAYAVGSGRRFRPLLFLLAYKVMGTEVDERAYGMATAVELLHKASLLHDDLIDGDDFRRGRKTFHHKYGMAKAVIVGDFLVAESSLRFARYASAEQRDHWLTLYRRLCYGEILDVIGCEGETGKDRVNEIIYGKTASFLEFIMGAAAQSAGASRDEARLLGKFGQHLGFMFQIINDWNNWSGFERQVGRRIGEDVRQGRMNHIALLLETGVTTPEDLEGEIRSLVELHASLAREALQGLGFSNKYTQLLMHMLEDKYASWYWVDRDSG